MLHVKLTVYYTVSLTCNIYFLNSTYFIFLIHLKLISFRVTFAAGYIFNTYQNPIQAIGPLSKRNTQENPFQAIGPVSERNTQENPFLAISPLSKRNTQENPFQAIGNLSKRNTQENPFQAIGALLLKPYVHQVV